MLDTKCAGDNFEMLVTIFTVFLTNIHYPDDYRFELLVTKFLKLTTYFVMLVIIQCIKTVNNIWFCHEDGYIDFGDDVDDELCRFRHQDEL